MLKGTPGEFLHPITGLRLRVTIRVRVVLKFSGSAVLNRRNPVVS